MFEFNSAPSQGRPVLEGIGEEWFGFADGVVDRSLQAEASTLGSYIVNNRDFLFPSDDGTIWSEYSKGHAAHMAVMETGIEANFRSLCSHLFQTPLTHGFAQSTHAYTMLRDLPNRRPHLAALILDKLHRLAEALDVIPVTSPEHVQRYVRDAGGFAGLLEKIEDALGIDITPPAVDGSLFGLRTKRGIMCERHFDSLYVAKRLYEMGHRSVVEIGGGQLMSLTTPEKWG